MAGTNHFSRMNYNVSRGLREIVAPRQTMPDKQWKDLKQRFSGRCVYCDELATQENRGIVPDHLIPIEQYGELVLGNTVPACQRCNDLRGKSDWKVFLETQFPAEASARAARITEYLQQYPYVSVSPQQVLAADELEDFSEILRLWNELLGKAKTLKQNTELRRNAQGRCS